MPGEKKKRYTDKQTDKRIHDHLVNEDDDSISEQDIENVKTDESITHANNHGEALPLSGEEEVKKDDEVEKDEQEEEEEKVVKNNSSPGIETPWNILDN